MLIIDENLRDDFVGLASKLEKNYQILLVKIIILKIKFKINFYLWEKNYKLKDFI